MVKKQISKQQRMKEQKGLAVARTMAEYLRMSSDSELTKERTLVEEVLLAKKSHVINNYH